MSASRASEGGAPAAVVGSKLSLTGVSKYYGRSCVVNDVTLEVQSGELVSLLGPSGSGKTTTMMMIAGFIHPETGSIAVDGKDLARVPPQKRDIGMVFQNYALFPHMTAAENIGFPLAMRRQPKASVKERVQETLKLVRLEGLGDRYPKQLSGGQQQRVALARALSFRPRLLLMDEPLGALDKKLREALGLEIMRIRRQIGVTVLYVTHDQTEALVLSDRIAIYKDGRIEQTGTGEDLYERPNSLFVADFVGESNILRGTLRVGARTEVILHGGGAVRVPEASCAGLSSGDRVAVIVRPERLIVTSVGTELDSASASDCSADLAGRVREVIYLGSDRKYVVDLEGGSAVTVRVEAGAETAAPTEPEVRVRWKLKDCVVVPDADTGIGPSGAGARVARD